MSEVVNALTVTWNKSERQKAEVQKDTIMG
jgi:hypothetical protein